MAWAQVDDGFHDHPKVLALLEQDGGMEALGLWTLCLSWCKSHANPEKMDDAGCISSLTIRRLGGDSDSASLLVHVGLWEQNGSGWRFHDFRTWQQLDLWAARRVNGKAGGRPRKPRSEPYGYQTENHMVMSSDDIEHAGQNHMVGTLPRSEPYGYQDKTRQDTKKTRQGTDVDPDFVAFWSSYPRKTDKGHARDAWRKALAKGADPAMVIAAARRYADDPTRKPNFTAHATTWLNGERWTDESPSLMPTNYSTSPWEN